MIKDAQEAKAEANMSMSEKTHIKLLLEDIDKRAKEGSYYLTIYEAVLGYEEERKRGIRFLKELGFKVKGEGEKINIFW